jgi:rod shape-determining protein MreD
MSRRGGGALQPSRWLGAPALAALAATILFALPLRVFGLSPPQPVFPMALAFAWGVIRPSSLGPLILFTLGLFLDLFWGGRLGLWPMALIAGYALTLAGRSLMAGQGSVVMAGWYAAACAAALGLAAVFATMVAQEQPNLIALGWQLLWTIALFPAAFWLVDRFEDADVRFR